MILKCSSNNVFDSDACLIVLQMIKLRIQSFDLPDCYLCGCAGLDVYDGETHNSPEVGRYCRNGWEEEELIFGGDAAYLEYDSYLLAPHAGFRIEYEFYDTACECKINHLVFCMIKI